MVVVKLENFWVSCTGNCLYGKGLDETVLNGFANSTLDIRNCRGQEYNGASSVSGYINSLSPQVLYINKKA